MNLKPDSKGYRSFVLFTYSTEHLVYKDKVRFYYALKGRDGKTGIVKHCRIEQLGRTVLLVTQQHAAEVEQFLKFWQCEYQRREVLVNPAGVFAEKPAELKDYRQRTIFTYNTEHLVYKDKVRFYYALKGRDGKTGIVKHCRIEQLGRTVLLVTQQHASEVEQFLKFWKCAYERREVLVR